MRLLNSSLRTWLHCHGNGVAPTSTSYAYGKVGYDFVITIAFTGLVGFGKVEVLQYEKV